MKHHRELKDNERKIEDMTEKDIKNLKHNIINQINIAITEQARGYDVGFVEIVFIRNFNKDKDGHVLGLKSYWDIKFSKEK